MNRIVDTNIICRIISKQSCKLVLCVQYFLFLVHMNDSGPFCRQKFSVIYVERAYIRQAATPFASRTNNDIECVVYSYYYCTEYLYLLFCSIFYFENPLNLLGLIISPCPNNTE